MNIEAGLKYVARLLTPSLEKFVISNELDHYRENAVSKLSNFQIMRRAARGSILFNHLNPGSYLLQRLHRNLPLSS